MVRVTKPGGRLLVVVPDSDSKGRPGMSAIELHMQVRTTSSSSKFSGVEIDRAAVNNNLLEFSAC